MTGIAILFLVISVVVVWGGLGMAVWYYRKSGAAGGVPPVDREGHPSFPRDT